MRVLSIDGGGIRGLIPALVLCELEARAKRPVAELFDLVVGTSTGGILACALTRPGAWPADRLVDLYRTEGPKIFHRSLGQKIRSGQGLLEEKHDARALEAALATYLGDGRLSDAAVRTLVTAYDLEARHPHFFKSWRADLDAPLALVGRATAAAPTYFEPVAYEGMSLVDGGVFATNPSMCAYAEVVRLTGERPEFVLSLGTGRLMRPIHHEDAVRWGLVQWVRPVIDVVFDGVGDTVEYQLGRLMPDDGVVRLQADLRMASDALDDASPRNLELLERQALDLVAQRSDALDRAVARLTRPAALRKPRRPGRAWRRLKARP